MFLVRAWREEGRFRARLTWSLDIGAQRAPEFRVVAAEPAEVVRRLQAWLEDFERVTDPDT